MLTDNLQTILDTVAEHLMKQGVASVHGHLNNGDDDNFCAYRGVNGLRCAVGCLIPDHLYRPDLEGRWGPHVLVQIGMIPPRELHETGPMRPRVRLLADLQKLHDRGVDLADAREMWASGLAQVARDHNLAVPPAVAAAGQYEMALPAAAARG